MGTKFAGQYPGKDGRRDQLLFLAAAGLAFSVLVILFLVNQKSVQANNPMVEPAAAAPPVVGTVTLFVPKWTIRSGTKLKESDFRDVYWPRTTVPEEAVRDLSEIRGKFAAAELPPERPLRRSDMTTEKRMVTLPITPGMRAVTIEVDAQQGLEGWALPNTKVDVALTYVQDGNLTSKVIVQNARVLSYAGSADAPEEISAAGPRAARRVRVGSTITLEVSPGDALTISTSRALGSLSLLMRAPDDDKSTPVTEVNRTTIEGGNSKNSRGAKKQCNRGVMRIEGREYVIDCDGSILQVNSGDAP